MVEFVLDSGTPEADEMSSDTSSDSSRISGSWSELTEATREFSRCDAALREALKAFWKRDGDALTRFVELVRLTVAIGHPCAYDRDGWTVRKAYSALSAAAYAPELARNLEETWTAWTKWEVLPKDTWHIKAVSDQMCRLQHSDLTFEKAARQACIGVGTRALLALSATILEHQYPRLYEADTSDRHGGSLRTLRDLVAAAAPDVANGSELATEIRALGAAWERWCLAEE